MSIDIAEANSLPSIPKIGKLNASVLYKLSCQEVY